MSRPTSLSEAQHQRVTEAVARAESGTAGEIVTVLADRSDGYSDVALAWAALIALLVLATMAFYPAAALGFAEQLQGGWVHDWSPRQLFTLAALATAVTFGVMVLLQLIPAVRFLLIPAPIKSQRVHDRALHTFRVSAEQRTTGRTGILIYLSMREQRAEVLADAAIATKVEADVWADALEAMLEKVGRGDIAEGMCAAIDQIGVVLAQHLPRKAEDVNELPDRLIEI